MRGNTHTIEEHKSVRMSLTLSVAPTPLDDGVAFQHRRQRTSLAFVAANLTYPARQQIETFIANGFATRYNAHITSFMPMLFALEFNGVKAAAGARCSATDSTNPVSYTHLTLPTN